MHIKCQKYGTLQLLEISMPFSIMHPLTKGLEHAYL